LSWYWKLWISSIARGCGRLRKKAKREEVVEEL